MTSTDHPSVSVIVPVYNDPAGIEETLTSLCDQNFIKEKYEIIVVDDGSTDRTRDVIRRFAKHNPRLVEPIVEGENRGSYAARNRGIRRANGFLLAFVDANVTVEKTWLKSIVASMDANECDYMGCDVDVYIEDGADTLVAAYNKLTGFPVEDYLKNDSFVPTCCLITRRDVFEEAGFFDARMISSGDFEFGQRVADAGFAQCYEPGITVYHPARSSLRSLLSKRFRVGRGLVQYSRYHSERFDRPIWQRPGNYLPPYPVRFRRRMRRKDTQLRAGELVLLFCIAYLAILARTAGVWYERFAGSDGRDRGNQAHGDTSAGP